MAPHRNESGFELGLAAVRLFQEHFAARVEEYDVRDNGDIDVLISLPGDPPSRKLILSKACVMRNVVVISRSARVLAQSREHAQKVRGFLARAGHATTD